MKARIKATGYIIEVYHDPKNPDLMIGESGLHYNKKILEIIDDPDYWTRLKHQYAGMAMQSYVSNNVYLREIREMCKEPQEMRDLIADLSILLATTLVQKLKEKEKRK